MNVNNYEELVIHSDEMDRSTICMFARKYVDTIVKIEEITYLCSSLDDITLNFLVLHHIDKIESEEDIHLLIDRLDSDLLHRIQDKLGAR